METTFESTIKRVVTITALTTFLLLALILISNPEAANALN